MSSDRVTSCCRRNGMTALSKFADVERCLRQLKLPAEARVLVRNVRADTSEKFLAIRRIHTTKVVVGFDISRSDLVQKSFGAHEAMAAPNTTYWPAVAFNVLSQWWQWQFLINLVFNALHGMQMRSSDENSVSPSVRLSVCQTRALWQNRWKICPDFYTLRKTMCLDFWEEEWLVGATRSTWNFGSTGAIGAKSPILNRYSLVAPQP